MYKRVSTALKQPKALIMLRLSTLILLTVLACIKYHDIQSFAFPIDLELLLQVLLVGFLTMINLSFEVFKYQVLYGRTDMNLRLALKSILSGMTVGIWTPNRAGEFIGRLKWAPKKKRVDAIRATVLGSLLQGLVTLVMGVLGIFYFDFSVQLDLPISMFILIGMVLLVASIIVFWSRPKPRFQEIRLKTSFNKILLASCFAVLRYFVFSTQFVILLYAFGLEGDLWQVYLGVFVLYVIQTYMPGSMLSELGIREVLAVFLFAPFFEGELGAVLAAFCLWLLNIGIPIASWSIYGTLNRLALR